jgi:phospholipid/cholesterol/gamma-HCH transport system substrate-binding protein
MRRAIRKHIWDVTAIVVLAVIAVLVGGYILSNQRFYLPAWVPVVGSDFVDYEAQFSTAQAFTAGQGQTVMIAGVNVGEIGNVRLKDGRALIQMKIKRKYTPIYKDATALSRPKTGLNDMVIELDPGNKSAGELPADGILPVTQTVPNVNPDEFLAGLDADTRDYIRLLIGGAGEGLRGNAENLSSTLKRFDPTARYLVRINTLLAKRQQYIKRSIRNFSLLSSTLGERDTQLARFVRESNEVFRSFADQQASLRETLRLLPGALDDTNTALAKSEQLTDLLGPTLDELQPAAAGLAPALRAFQEFATDTTPVLRDEIRPFTKQAAPTAAALEPASADLAATLPKLNQSFQVLNQLFDQLAYNPSGKQEGYLFWLAWANHSLASAFGSQDAHGPALRGTVFGNCSTLQTLEAVGNANALLGTLADLLNSPTPEQAGAVNNRCPAPKASSASAARKADAAIARQVRSAGLNPGEAPPDAALAAAPGLGETPAEPIAATSGKGAK